MRIRTLAIAALILAAPATSMADTSTPLGGQTNVAPLVQLNPGGKTAGDFSNFASVSRYWRCPRRRGYKVTHMTFRRGRGPLCHYRKLRRHRVGYQGRGWRSTRAAWRHCRRKYGRRVIRALESRTQYRCIYRRHSA